MGDYIETFTGKRFRPLAPAIEDICIEDIAHALSNQCRFSGHTWRHFSVAQHSINVCAYLRDQGFSETVQLWGLLHDASEAYLVDLPSPLKHQPEFLPYRQAEARLMKAICERFGLPDEEPAAVKDADARMLAEEAFELMPFNPLHWTQLEHRPMGDSQLHPILTIYGVNKLFISEFRRLSDATKNQCFDARYRLRGDSDDCRGVQ